MNFENNNNRGNRQTSFYLLSSTAKPCQAIGKEKNLFFFVSVKYKNILKALGKGETMVKRMMINILTFLAFFLVHIDILQHNKDFHIGQRDHDTSKVWLQQ